MDIKVEQAIIDLQDMKIKMVDSTAQQNHPLPNIANETQQRGFRISAYTNMNTT